MDWYPWYPEDFRHDTLHLSLAEDGAYRRLIDEYMIRRGPLPDDDCVLGRLLGVGRDEWVLIAPAVRKFFRIRDGKLHHKRCDAELLAQDRRFERFSKRGKKAAFVKQCKTNGFHTRGLPIPTTLKYTAVSLSSSDSVTAQKGASKLAEIVRAKGWVK